MTDERPPAPDGTLDPATLLGLGAVLFIIGGALGMIQPLFAVSIGATMVAGPTYVGLLFLLCAGIALAMGVVAIVGVRWFAVPAFVISGSLALGLFVGFLVAATFDIGFAAGRRTTVEGTSAPSSPVRVPVVLEAPATVTFRLDGVPGFTPNDGQERYTVVNEAGQVVADGVFGQWCYSKPDTEEVGSIETLDVGTLGTATVRATLRLIAPGLPPMSMALPRVQVVLVRPGGEVTETWGGQGHVRRLDGTGGSVAFDFATDDTGAPATLAGELSWTCSDWLAKDP